MGAGAPGWRTGVDTIRRRALRARGFPVGAAPRRPEHSSRKWFPGCAPSHPGALPRSPPPPLAPGGAGRGK
ncbi:hypothetical protein HMPREF1550_02465, partial [Actinomyces sp. oral taxon 877 str. F0543]